ncbi:sensor domain-containing diguanylate cyclase [Ectobacillus sp. JY-23]|uniref:GGDEF domain-containing protein n=1 Tax=Ectobacillus sp. JY-23 TaxID=2933872 RepID=UPI001FF6F794|nr:sensor domain-containing diguanylate cyclase [Ectobacillus sp. JY-23]UOY94349.1 sensor domain-containing diguanylate cyclase [Ectobacillus sp. JY-23]
MLGQYIQVMVYAILLAMLVNYFRFKGTEVFNKSLLVTAVIFLIGIEGIVFVFMHTKWLMLLLIATTVLMFRLVGGFIGVGIAWLSYCMLAAEWNVLLLLNYLFFMGAVYTVMLYIHKRTIERQELLHALINNSKQLNVFKEVSFSMQRTLEFQKLLQTILTAVTAGHGLGFNRAMILLTNETETKLTGIMGIGPMSAEEGYKTWSEIVKNRYKLNDLIEINEAGTPSDVLLNDRVRELVISLQDANFLYKVLESGIPMHIKDLDTEDQTLRLFVKQFHMSELAVLPLINQGHKVGVLIIDNPVNKKPITMNDIDSVMTLANQAAIAIRHSRLYTRVEEMAHKDGLTGLFNQRTFQATLQRYMDMELHLVSLIILDVDYFKHFNDTNGHMAGNEVLIQIASIMKHSIRENDLAFRFGGEEFIILLPHTTNAQATEIAERIRINIADTTFIGGDKQPLGHITVSLGVATTESEIDMQELVEAADQALYKAKHAGRNMVMSCERGGVC